jgi:nitronate monooxygenase
MSQWPDTRILDLLGIELPIIQGPMAGATNSSMVIAVCNAGGLGSMPAAMLSSEQLREELKTIRQYTTQPFNVNFFCHQPPAPDEQRARDWKNLLEPYYRELGADFDAPTPVSNRAPFDEAACVVLEEFRPEVVSFHFGLPEKNLLDRVKATGAKILSSATTVEEAIWLEQHGCDAIIAMGYEAGGHRGMFLSDDLSTQVGTFALVPQVVDAVKVPVIAAGAISDARGVAAGSQSQRLTPQGPAHRQGKPDRHHQHFHRTSGAGHCQSGDARTRPDVSAGAGLSVGRRCADAAADQG